MKPSILFALAFGSVALLSCSKSDIEDEDWCIDPRYKVPLEVTVNLDDSFRDYCSVDTMYATKSENDDSGVKPYLKYYVAAYPTNPSLPVVVASSVSKVVSVSIHPGKYKLVGWVDYEKFESTTNSRGLNFHTDDFGELLLKNKYTYTGADRYKLGFRGAEDKNVAYNMSSTSVTVTPAMGCYRIVATDTASFTPSKVVIKYSSLLPAAINAKTGRINWWWDDISYSSPFKGDTLASDFVFSQPMETSVNVIVEIYDDCGNLRARKKDVRIPLVNGGVTTVKGNFFSVLESEPASSTGSGITIKTEWDASFEIEL